MKAFRKILWGGLILIIVFLLFLTWYNNEYSMKVSPAYSVNTPEASSHLLIATQGSEFKDKVVNEVVSHFQNKEVFIRVMDVTDLSRMDVSEWDATFIFHTWEYGAPPKELQIFVDGQSDFSKILFFATSGGGDEYIRGVDGISGASKMTEVNEYVVKVQEGINDILEKDKKEN